MSVLKVFVKPKVSSVPTCSAVILAAGASERMGTDKILADLGGMPVIARTVMAFERSGYISEIIVVTRQESIVKVADICKKYDFQKVKKVICGGDTRAQSALAGVCEVNPRSRLIAIHDGARPLVRTTLIADTLAAAAENIAAAPAVRPTDTIKIVGEDGVVTETVDRNIAVLIQTPQIFESSMIKGALTRAAELNLPITDDCSAVEALGVRVHTVEGDPDNIKLTHPADMYAAERILRDRGEIQ
jgi:2-C-methyl-D-erythritol 4-phosphate cytidylyltransferase